MPIEELSQKFSIKNYSRSPAKYDPKHLTRWQSESVQKLNLDEMKKWLGDIVLDKVPTEKQELFWETIKPNVMFPEDVEEWIEILFGSGVVVDDEKNIILQEAGAEFFRKAKDLVEKNGPDYNVLKSGLQEALDVKGKNYSSLCASH